MLLATPPNQHVAHRPSKRRLEGIHLLRAANADADTDAKADLVRFLHATQDVTPLQEDNADDSMDADAPLTKQELEWIVATRDVAATQSLPCTNVELVQLAIVTKGDTAKTLSRLKKMAAWKKDLSLDDVSFADAFRKNNATVMTSGYGTLTPYGRARSGSRVLCHWHSVRPMHMLPPLLTSVCGHPVCATLSRGVYVTRRCAPPAR